MMLWRVANKTTILSVVMNVIMQNGTMANAITANDIDHSDIVIMANVIILCAKCHAEFHYAQYQYADNHTFVRILFCA